MSRKSKSNDGSPSNFPSKEAIIAYIKAQDVPPTKRELAQAFRIRGDDRVLLKKIVRELKLDKVMPAGRRPPAENRPGSAGVVTMRVLGYNSGGQLQAVMIDPATGETAEDSKTFLLKIRHGEESPQPGVHVLAKPDTGQEGSHRALLVRELPPMLTHFLGIYKGVGDHGTVDPVERKIKETFGVHHDHAKAANDGELVYCRLLPAEQQPRGRGTVRAVEILERIGRLDSPRSASLIAIHNHDIPMEFPPEAVKIAEAAKPPVMKEGRVDLREVPLVTIDGADARDFDDAVFAEKDGDGWHLVVAIADVAHYVRFGSALDNEAFLRGNSVYFPDRVVPMLPEALSNGLCSLNPNEDRFCLAVHLYIDATGKTTRYKFVRGLMRSKARLTYEQVQAAYDGEPGLDPELVENQIKPLYGVYAALNKSRIERGALDLDLPEHKVAIDENGIVTSIALRQRFDSHKLIEECMIAANVAAAHAIETADAPGLFRVHEQPDFERVVNLRGFLQQMGYQIARQEKLSSHHFNEILEKAKEAPEAHVIHMAVLRSQMAAYYDPKNLGHFGLALAQYCHFTSPIRRYSDLIVHRSLIDIIKAVDSETDGLVFEQAENLNSIATHISQTERRAMLAEREANDRYITSYMSDKVGKEFAAVIASVNSFGFFIEVKENGAQGLVPIRSLGNDFYLFDKEKSKLVGRSSGEVFFLGQKVAVMLMAADTLVGTLSFALTGREVHFDKNAQRGHGGGPRREGGQRDNRDRGKHGGNRHGGDKRKPGGKGQENRKKSFGGKSKLKGRKK